MSDGSKITYTWRGKFSNVEIHAVHAEAFGTRLYDESEWNWIEQCERYSLGWVVARDGSRFVGFVNVLWDGLVHAYLEDVMVSAGARKRGVGVGLVRAARDGAERGRVRVPPRELRRGAAHLLHRRLRVRTHVGRPHGAQRIAKRSPTKLINAPVAAVRRAPSTTSWPSGNAT